MVDEKKVSLIVLASGFSRRFGKNKLLECLGGKSLLEHVTGNALKSDHYEIIVVVEPGNDEIRKLIPPETRVIENRTREMGLSSAVREGVRAMDSKSDAALFMVADQPFVTADLINSIIAKFRKECCEIVACSYAGVMRNPMLFSRVYFKELDKIEGDVGARQVAEFHNESVCRIEIEDTSLLLDIDTEEDLEVAREILKN